MSEIKNSPAMLTVIGRINDQLARSGDRAAAQDFDLDTKLTWLVGRVGNIALTTRRNDAVFNAACCAFACLEALWLSPEDILQRIANQRVRQRDLFAQRVHHFRVDSAVVDCGRSGRGH